MLILERSVLFFIGMVFLALILVTKPVQKYLFYRDSLLRYDKGRNGKDPERFHARVYRLFWAYFVIGFSIGLGSFFLQFLSTHDVASPIEWYVYFVFSGNLCYFSRILMITPFISDDNIAKEVINHTFILVFLGVFFGVVHLSVLWILDPLVIYDLLYLSYTISISIFGVINRVILLSLIIFIMPFGFASAGEVLIELLIAFCKKFLKGCPR